ncbi:vWA domain-containing protein [Argonema galeatum]|uniref:vWA domain-containing protein n=1 Tax=Argonema galeatum TaxID=2942762 RepID=UPI00201139CB|nr:vWA domain-containing protein [Argonema galeatum]MCL1463935.1 VWA domain-containing protein [Argonema galeatum A003/A1]
MNKLKIIAFSTLLALLPLPVLSNSLEIYRVTTKQDKVTLRVKVLDDERVPIAGLNKNDFRITTTNAQGNSVRLSPSQITLLSSEQSKPDPAKLVMLLDMSGSMNNEDSGGTKKLDGAVGGVREFINEVKGDNWDVRISLVPFGEGCKNSFTVNEIIIDKNFSPSWSPDLNLELDKLAKVDVCAATNIYQPLEEAVKYLGNLQQDPNDKSPPPRLAVILLSDGYDVVNDRSDESERFDRLLEVFQQYPKVTVHTMGYGEKLKELRDRIRCNLSDNELTVDNLKKCRSDIDSYIVDEPRLKQIAEATGGINAFPANAAAVADTLRKFLSTLREYEIEYEQPGARRSGNYEVTVSVNSPSRRLTNVRSDRKPYRLDTFDYIALPLSERLPILGSILMLGLGTMIPFIWWSKQLKDSSFRDLNS